MFVTTSSGSQYQVIEVKGTGKFAGLTLLRARKWLVAGARYHPVVGVFPDRLPFLESTTEWLAATDGSGKLEGFNQKGSRTLRLIPTALAKGMVLAGPTGLRSTEIVEIRQ
jgi:hypothetical protein